MPTLAADFTEITGHVRTVTKALIAELNKRMAEGAERVGISVLGNVQKAYDVKARKGTGEDGIAWKDLSPKTLEARVRRRAPARKIIEERRQLAQEIRGILSGGISPTTKRGKAIAGNVAVDKLRQRRAALSRKMLALITKEMSAYEIGIDTGLQRSSASPGLPQDRIWKTPPRDTLGQNLFRVEPGSVTIGYDREYSRAFDSQRKIIPDTLPAPWQTQAEVALRTWADQVIAEGEN